MECYVELDVSLKRTSICVVNQTGSVVRESAVDSDPEEAPAISGQSSPLSAPPTARFERGLQFLGRGIVQFVMFVKRKDPQDYEPRCGLRRGFRHSCSD
jgi:hypothetical protein